MRPENRHDGRAVRQAALQRPAIGGQHALEEPLGQRVDAAVVRLGRRLQEPAAQHGGEGQRDEAGDEDGRADRHGELVEQPADDSAHEEHRDEHRGQRQGHGDDGEADLPRPVQGRLERRFPHLHVAHDVLEHDDGVVHHEAHRERQGHEREVVQAVAQQIHDREGPDDRHGQGQAGDDRGGEVAQEEEDHQHDQGTW